MAGYDLDELLSNKNLEIANLATSLGLARICDNGLDNVDKLEGSMMPSSLQLGNNITPSLCKQESGELSELKKSLNVEVEQLRSEFQELRGTLQQQQEDVTTSLRNLGLQDSPGNGKGVQDPKVEEKDEEINASTEDTDKKAES